MTTISSHGYSPILEGDPQNPVKNTKEVKKIEKHGLIELREQHMNDAMTVNPVIAKINEVATYLDKPMSEILDIFSETTKNNLTPEMKNDIDNNITVKDFLDKYSDELKQMRSDHGV